MTSSNTLRPDNSSQPGGNPAKKLPWTVHDTLAIILGLLLLAAMAKAAIYGMEFTDVDESVVPGKIEFVKNGKSVFALSVHDDMTAAVKYKGQRMTGTLTFAGAEEDTILYQLRDISLTDGTKPEDYIVFVRMPRLGIQGDYSGVWMVYFRSNSLGVRCSDWIFADKDGTAIAGHRNKTNAVATRRLRLLEWSHDYLWHKDGNRLAYDDA